MSAITVFATESRSIVFTTKKGDLKSVTPEGALFRGGAALASLKDAALESALSKANGGRYNAAADIIETAFPSVAKAVRSLMGEPCANKTNMGAMLTGVERAVEPTKGWSKKAQSARSLVRAMRSLKAFEPVNADIVTIEA